MRDNRQETGRERIECDASHTDVKGSTGQALPGPPDGDYTPGGCVGLEVVIE